VKAFLIRAALGIMQHVPRMGPRARVLYRRLEMADLFRRDMMRWRLEAARDAGVKVGAECRLYSLNIFSEPCLVEIGDRVIVSGEVIFLTHDGAIYTLRDEIPDVQGHYGRIRIGNNCFIGMRAIILPNVQIGNNCIIGAGAVVADSFPDNSVIMGNPGRLVFSHGMYRQMRMKSPFTITDERYPFPSDYPPELLLERIGHLPIREPRRR
jgi:acetyltransferase-like isoleucine patch superfamily enzyme